MLPKKKNWYLCHELRFKLQKNIEAERVFLIFIASEVYEGSGHRMRLLLSRQLSLLETCEEEYFRFHARQARTRLPAPNITPLGADLLM